MRHIHFLPFFVFLNVLNTERKGLEKYSVRGPLTSYLTK